MTLPSGSGDTPTLEQHTRAAPDRTSGRQANWGGPSLVITHLDHVWLRRLPEAEPLTIGRDVDAGVSIADPSVSRRHAEFENRAGIVTVRDLGSTNGTCLNGQRVERATIKVGDEVAIGNVTATLHVNARRGSAGALPHDQFLVALDDEVDRARTFGRGFVVAMVRTRDSAQPLSPEGLRSSLRAVDRQGVFGGDSLELLLPELDATRAASMLASLAVYAGVAAYPADGLSAEALLEASRQALRQASSAAPVQLATPRPVATSGDVVCVNPAMIELFETVDRAASAVVPVLVRGETGTGKEVLARAIHDRGPRRKRRFVAINCAAIPATLLEAALFGYERGAFTGALSATPGVFEEANGSTLLLDEVGELSPAAQAALLRVLETRAVKRLGASHELRLDVRVISATHRDLERMVAAGTFREDLYYRLNTLTLEVPPLRDRPEEIGPLVDRFLALANAANGREITAVGPEATRILLRHAWPGNIRELRNTIEHAVVVARGAVIQAEDLSRRIREPVRESAPSRAHVPKRGSLREELHKFEREMILEALDMTQGNKTEAAKSLEIPLRTLARKIAQHGIRRGGFDVDGHEGQA